MDKTHYEILGLKDSADRRAVRAAWLKKIKSAHPDGGRSRASKERAARINQAYFILRDPRRRLAYDLDLKRARAAAGEPADGPVALWEPRAIAPRRGGVRAPPPPRSRKAVASGVLLGAAIFGLILIIADLGSARGPLRQAPPPTGDSAAPLVAAERPWVDRAMVDRAVETVLLIRAGGRPRDALAYSRNCHAELERRPSALLLDHCLAFDVAAAQWRAPPAAEADVDFAPEPMRLRHEAALRRVQPADNGGRLREVNHAALAALARRLGPAAEPGLPRLEEPNSPTSSGSGSLN